MAYYLDIELEDGTDDLRILGLQAAKRVLENRNLTAMQAAQAAFARELWDECGFDPQHEPSTEQMQAAEAWDEAISAARTACDATTADIHLIVVRAEKLPAHHPGPLTLN